jgi:hypothetical protein
MSAFNIPESVKRQVWEIVRPFKDIKLTVVGPTLGWAITRVFGRDKWI